MADSEDVEQRQGDEAWNGSCGRAEQHALGQTISAAGAGASLVV